MSAFITLAERAETGSSPDTVLDRDVAMVFAGADAVLKVWENIRGTIYIDMKDGRRLRLFVEPVTCSIDAGEALRQRLLPDSGIEASRWPVANGNPACWFARITSHSEIFGFSRAPTEARSRLAALLRALAITEEPKP